MREEPEEMLEGMNGETEKGGRLTILLIFAFLPIPLTDTRTASIR